MIRLPRDPSELFCDPCAQMTPHVMGAVTDGNAPASAFVCKVCGLTKLGGRTLTRPV
jgi:hypothetical protein